MADSASIHQYAKENGHPHFHVVRSRPAPAVDPSALCGHAPQSGNRWELYDFGTSPSRALCGACLMAFIAAEAAA